MTGCPVKHIMSEITASAENIKQECLIKEEPSSCLDDDSFFEEGLTNKQVKIERPEQANDVTGRCVPEPVLEAAGVIIKEQFDILKICGDKEKVEKKGDAFEPQCSLKPDPGSMVSHEETYNQERRYNCEHCKKSFYFRSSLISHLYLPIGKSPFQCAHYQKSYTRRESLNQHLQTHSGEKPFKSEHCQKSFYSRRKMMPHLLVHLGERPFKCEHCQKSFTRRGCLKRHLKTHGGDKPFKCEHCQKSFTRRGCLKRHLKTHGGDKPFKCEHCQKSFFRRKFLLSHLQVHRAEKPFKCERCRKLFSRRRFLMSHLTKHSAEKPYVTKRPHTPLKLSEEELKTQVKVVHMTKSKFKSNTSLVILECSAAARYALLSQDRSSFSLSSFRATNHEGVTRCFKCQDYGHLGRCCASAQACALCAGSHDVTTCPEKDSVFRKCINCVRAKTGDHNHPAVSTQCPAYQRALEVMKRRADCGFT